MKLLWKTLGCLKSYWPRIIVASISAALHALMASLLVWIAGPLLMTLFAVSNINPPGARSATQVESADRPGSGTEEVAEDTKSDILPDLDFLARSREGLKAEIHKLVSSDTQRGTLMNFCWLIIFIAVSSNVFLYLQGFFMAYVQQSVIRDFRNHLFEKYQQLSLSFFHRERTGQVISRVTNDVIVLNETVDLGFNRLVTDSLMVILLVSFLILLSWKLTLLAVLVLPLVFGFIWWMGRKLRKYSHRSQEKMADVNSVLEETVSNIRIVKGYAMENFEIRKFFRATREFFRALVRMTRIRHLSNPVNEVLIVVAGILILLFAGTRILEGAGEMDAGDFMTFILAMFSLIKPTKSLLQIHIKIQEGLAAAERIFDVLEAPVKVKESDTPVKKDKFESSIKYENVNFSYIPGEPVLEDISFDVKKGEVVALVGSSGAGKSTLFDLLPRFYDPLEGRILIDDVDIRDMKLVSLRGMLGIVTQETYLFNDTIRHNIAYGLNGIPQEEIATAARAANADCFIEQFEDRYDTVVGNRGVRLSGGQRQRIAIARALLKNPQILIFDEATSALDTESELLVQEAIDRLMANRTTLVIAHRLSTIQNADRIMVLNGGRIVENGTHEQLMKRGGLYEHLYTMQFKDRP
ncbi:MAG: ABC transporter ATP-binding protein [Candidatus Zixiibacteriota bacterium]|nr:MAG: ABC transporter ATP-binding protein [candidate division Zixibacteria bacterium]